jgi:hypothetical protein
MKIDTAEAAKRADLEETKRGETCPSAAIAMRSGVLYRASFVILLFVPVIYSVCA